jgi:hypothetical protein
MKDLWESNERGEKTKSSFRKHLADRDRFATPKRHSVDLKYGSDAAMIDPPQ